MKNKVDLRELKSKHRIEKVMVETGEKLSLDDRYLRGSVTPGLTVDPERQIYKVDIPGKQPEMGDVYSWLRRRYQWSFGMAIRFLQNRPPDTDHTENVAFENTLLASDQRKPVKRDPMSADGLDQWQRKALDLFDHNQSWIAGWFEKDYFEIADALSDLPGRFLEVIALDVDECAECGAEFDWEKKQTRAYIEQFGDFNGAPLLPEDQQLFILDNPDIENLICDECVHKHARLYLALRYCQRSAALREFAPGA